MNTPEEQIKSIFLNAAEIAGESERSAYLDERCGDDAELRREIDELLRHQRLIGTFLETSSVGAVTIDQPITENPGTQIGPYKLLQQIGEGGMGVVYMAEQHEPVRRKVALKIIKPGMDTRQVIARFEAERQALAMMDHPNIARVFDAGTTDSRQPYFVMELVKGLPITQYCDERRLTPCERLDLFLPVCQAIQHAHQKGIIHRDIKPSNILVAEYDQQVVPKVIDFGVAKAVSQPLSDKTLFTGFGQIIGTLEYMSPEQAKVNQLDIDTRSDVYSLGVLLYELLTGTTPLDKDELRSAAWDEMLRTIREKEPPRPSTRLSTISTLPTVAANRRTEPHRLGNLVRGDLDWIVMKALEKDRSRRYATPSDFAADIERHLKLDPIQARPASAWERRWRWCRKNPAVASLSGALLLVFAIGFVGTALLWRRAEIAAEREAAQRTNAESQRERANREADLAKSKAEEASASAVRADRAAEQASDYLYAARMNVAQHAWDDGQVGEASELLRLTKPREGERDRRSFEWNYLARLLNSHLVEFKLGASGANDMAYSPDGQLLAAASYGVVELWSVRDARRLHSFSVPGNAQCLTFSPDSKAVVAPVGVGNLEYENNITSWNVETGTSRTIAKCQGGVRQLLFSPDGKRLAAAIVFSPITVIASQEKNLRSGEIKVWRVADGEERYSIDFRLPNFKDRTKAYAAATEVPPARLAFSPDGTKLVGTTGFGMITVWNANDGNELMDLDGAGASATFGNDGEIIRSEAATWNASDGSLVTRRTNAVTWQACDRDRVAWFINNRTFAVGKIETGATTAVLRGHDSDVHRLALNPDGWRIASLAAGMIRTWDAAGGQEAQTLRHFAVMKMPYSGSPQLSATAISPDGLRIATVVNGMPPFAAASIKVWDRVTGRVLWETSEAVSTGMNLEFSGDGNQLAAAFIEEGTIAWDASTGQQLRRFNNEGRYATYSRDGAWIATTGTINGKASIVIRDAATGELVCQPKIDWYSIDRLAFHPNGKTLMLGGRRAWEQPGKWTENDVITVCRVVDGQVIASRQGPVKQMTCMAYSPDGTRLAIASRSAVHLLDASSLEVVKSLDEVVESVAFSRDGRRLLTGNDDMIRVRDVDSLQEVLRLRGASTGLSFDASGSFLVAGGMGNEQPGTDASAVAKVWDLRPVADDDKIERVAMGLIRHLASQSLSDSEIEDHIRTDRTVNNAARQQVLALWADYLARKSMAIDAVDQHSYAETATPDAQQTELSKKDVLDLSKLQGRWKIIQLQADGQQAPPEIVATLKFVFQERTLSITPGEPGFTKYEVKLHADTKPAHIDLVHADGTHQGETRKGIYLFDRGRLKLCLHFGADRPQEFSAPTESRQVLYVLERDEL